MTTTNSRSARAESAPSANLVYVASPYSKGDPAINVRFQMQIFDELMRDGVVYPYVPLWSHFQHLMYPLPYDMWLEYDLEAIIPRCNAVLRLNAVMRDRPHQFYKQAESSGADKEVELAERLGIPVFYRIEDLYKWAKGNS